MSGDHRYSRSHSRPQCGTPRDRLHLVEDKCPRTGAIRNSYYQGELLGKGGFAKCYRATHCTTGEVFALKVIDKASLTRPKTLQKLKSEIKIHSSLRHKHIVGFKSHFEDANYVYILLELCEGLTLMEHSKRKHRFTEAESSYLLWQCLLALRYMHRLGVIHRDLKLGNIMLTDKMEVKVGDFGLAARLDFEGERKRTVCGTPNYIAPEILDTHSGRGHSFEVDVWTIGVIMYTLLVGRPPFETTDVKALYKRIKAVSYTFPPEVRVSTEARDLIYRILQATPESRPTLEQLGSDRWFRVCPPMQLAPLSLFIPGKPAHARQQQRLQLAQQRAEMYNEEWLRSRRDRGDRQPLQDDGGRSNVRSASTGPPLSKYASSSSRRAPLTARGAGEAGGRENVDPEDLRRGRSPCIVGGSGGLWDDRNGQRRRSADRTPHEPDQYAPRSARTATLAPPVLSASPRGGETPAQRAPSSPAMLTPQQRLYTQSPRTRDGYASPGGYGTSQAPTSATAAPSVGHSGGTAPGTGQGYYSDRRQGRSEGYAAPLPPPAVTGHSPELVQHEPRPQRQAVSLTPPGRQADRAPSERPPSDRAGSERAPSERVPPHADAPLAPRFAPFSGAAPAASPGPAPAAAPADENDGDDKQNLTNMHHNLEQTFQGDHVSPPSPRPAPVAGGPQLWVTQYADFTAKYGLAYRLSNGQVGVHYNDSTKMVLDTMSGNIEYVARRRTTRANGQAAVSDELQSVTVDQYPDNLKKKVTLIKYFREYLHKAKGRPRKEGQQEVVTCSQAREPPIVCPPSSRMVYVKRWLKTDQATIFRLSNKSVQVCFLDHTEIILSSEARLVTYTDTSGCRSTFSLSSMISHPQQEIAQRLKYTKDIICKLINVQPS